MLAAYLIDPNKRRYNLDTLAMEYLQHRTIKYSDVAGSGKKQLRFDEVSVEEAIPYAAEDADITLQLAERMLDELGEMNLTSLLDDVEVPLARVIAEMEDIGIKVDVDFLQELSDEFEGRLGAIEEKVFEAAGEEFTINSPKQLSEILFDKLGLPVIKRTKTGYSTDQSVLNELKSQHELPELILDYRHLSKLKSTYVDSLPELVHADTGRVHSSFNQAVAATGRLSSSNPNLQNIPIRSEEGRRIREAFVAEDGWLLCGGDYSQIELRILAHMSQDPVLLQAFRDGEDIHRRTASEIFEVEPDEVTADQRAAAKTINFGLIYGMGSTRLSNELDISRSEASDYIDRYFARLKKVQPFFDKLKGDAADKGYVETMIGRRRPIPELRSGRGRLQALGERLAMNTPIQGSAADIIKVAMIAIQRRLKNEGLKGRLLIQVHDELLFEAPEDEIDVVMDLAKEEMEGAMDLDVPLLVEFYKGHSWAELK
jgi:DNA polymerase-1